MEKIRKVVRERLPSGSYIKSSEQYKQTYENLGIPTQLSFKDVVKEATTYVEKLLDVSLTSVQV